MAETSTIELDPLVRFSLEALTKQPLPPREVAFGRLFIMVGSSRSSRLMLMLGTFFTFLALVMLTYPSGASTITILAVATAALLSLVSPLISALRMYEALQHGSLGHATVTAVSFRGPNSQHTRDAPFAGVAFGTRTVHTVDNTFIEDFEIEASWARDITEGSRLCVLVHPRKPKTVLELGP